MEVDFYMLLIVAPLVALREKLERIIVKYIIPLFITFGYVEKFLIVALAYVLLYLLIFVVGLLVVAFCGYVVRVLRKHRRRKNKN